MKLLEKVERRLGERLFLKGERCLGPKCALVRRAYPPGAHGKGRKKGRRGLSEYGELLREKQKVRFFYQLDDKDMRRYTKEAAEKAGIFSSNFLQVIESRLDNVVWKLGFASSLRVARQLVSHGHITVNGRRVNIPSYRLSKGAVVGIREASLPIFTDMEARFKKYEPPVWLLLDKEKKMGTVVAVPIIEDLEANIKVTKIKEFYSR